MRNYELLSYRWTIRKGHLDKIDTLNFTTHHGKEEVESNNKSNFFYNSFGFSGHLTDGFTRRLPNLCLIFADIYPSVIEKSDN
jgi:hypothetical protein